jgi:hypothetical protein
VPSLDGSQRRSSNSDAGPVVHGNDQRPVRIVTAETEQRILRAAQAVPTHLGLLMPAMRTAMNRSSQTE